jgi:polyisoprenoid-binding protein YceI
LNIATNDVAFSVDIKSFEFDKSLMKEHFNEKYMESEKFPTATFSGKFEGYDARAKGIQQVKAKGNLTIHGRSRTIEVPGTLENLNDRIRLKTKFIVRLADHDISIPTLLWQNIAEQVEVRVDVTYPTK